jgi:hypothetical protein
MDRFRSTLLLVTAALALPACLTTRAEQRVSRGMTADEVKRALGQPYSQSRVIKQGVPTEIWLFREVQNRADGRKEIMDSSVFLENGRVVEVSAVSQSPAEKSPVPVPSILDPRR